MPTPRKPTNTKQDRRPQRERRLEVVVATSRAGGGEPKDECPEPPDGLLDESSELWRAFWREPQAAEIAGAQRVVARRWIKAYDQWARAMAVIEAQPIVAGSTGQPVQNPLMTWAVAREVEMEKCERQLGVGLRNRADLGIAVGTAKLTIAELNRMVTDGLQAAAASQEASGDEDLIEAEVLGGFEAG